MIAEKASKNVNLQLVDKMEEAEIRDNKSKVEVSTTFGQIKRCTFHVTKVFDDPTIQNNLIIKPLCSIHHV